MARKASIEKNNNRKEISSRYWKYRRELRAKSIDANASEEEKSAAFLKLQKLPKNTAAERTRTRCELSGRPRGNYRKFGLSRIAFRKLALDGKLPGVTKASW